MLKKQSKYGKRFTKKKVNKRKEKEKENNNSVLGERERKFKVERNNVMCKGLCQTSLLRIASEAKIGKV